MVTAIAVAKVNLFIRGYTMDHGKTLALADTETVHTNTGARLGLAFCCFFNDITKVIVVIKM